MSDLENTKLILLSLSKNLLVMVDSGNLSEFESLNGQFQRKLQEAADQYGPLISPIYPSLIEDNNALITLVELKQSLLSKERASQFKSLNQVKAYLKEAR